MMLLNAIVTKNPAFVARKLFDDWVFIPINEPLTPQTELLNVDDMAVVFYDSCDGFLSVQQIIAQLADRFDVDIQTVTNDVLRVLSALVNSRILLLATHDTVLPVSKSELVEEKVSLIPQRIPLSASFEITGRCNLQCVHCYVASERVKQDLSKSQVVMIIDKLYDAGCVMLQLTGGECTARRDFLEIYLYAKQKGMIITVSTNACLLTEEIIAQFCANPPYLVSVSIYGADVDTFEGVTRRRGAFKRFVSNIESLRAHDIPIELKAIILRENVNNVEAMKSFAVKYGCQFKLFAGLVPTVRGEINPLTHQVQDEDLVRLFGSEGLIKSKDDDNTNRSLSAEGLFECNAGNTYFHIDCEGNMHLCMLERSAGYSLLKGELKEGWERLNSVRQTALRISEQCRTCSVNHFCYVCPPIINLVQQIPNQKAVIAQFCRFAHLHASTNPCPVD